MCHFWCWDFPFSPLENWKWDEEVLRTLWGWSEKLELSSPSFGMQISDWSANLLTSLFPDCSLFKDYQQASMALPQSCAIWRQLCFRDLSAKPTRLKKSGRWSSNRRKDMDETHLLYSDLFWNNKKIHTHTLPTWQMAQQSLGFLHWVEKSGQPMWMPSLSDSVHAKLWTHPW